MVKPADTIVAVLRRPAWRRLSFGYTASVSVAHEVGPFAGDFLVGDRRVRPSRNLVELPADGAEPGAGAGGAGNGRDPAPAAVQVEPKVMEVLVCLARRAGRVVTKHELVREVWEGRFVSDDVVWRSVRELRRALGDEARAPRFIETIPRRGYRLLAPVAEVPEPGGPAARDLAPVAVSAAAPAGAAAPEIAAVRTASHPAVTEDSPPSPPAPWRRRARPAMAAGLALLALLAAVVALGAAWWLGARQRPVAGGPVRIAVLPLANLSGDASQDYFADGITEELISRLGSLRPGRLAVIGRTSVMAVKKQGGDAREIGRRLGSRRCGPTGASASWCAALACRKAAERNLNRYEAADPQPPRSRPRPDPHPRPVRGCPSMSAANGRLRQARCRPGHSKTLSSGISRPGKNGVVSFSTVLPCCLDNSATSWSWPSLRR
jgi:DNA-binding winged helix-turn-helix (wHTH) protein